MPRKQKWKIEKFRAMKVKIYEPTFDRYKLVLAGKKKTIQQDLEEHVIKTINE